MLNLLVCKGKLFSLSISPLPLCSLCSQTAGFQMWLMSTWIWFWSLYRFNGATLSLTDKYDRLYECCHICCLKSNRTQAKDTVETVSTSHPLSTRKQILCRSKIFILWDIGFNVLQTWPTDSSIWALPNLATQLWQSDCIHLLFIKKHFNQTNRIQHVNQWAIEVLEGERKRTSVFLKMLTDSLKTQCAQSEDFRPPVVKSKRHILSVNDVNVSTKFWTTELKSNWCLIYSIEQLFYSLKVIGKSTLNCQIPWKIIRENELSESNISALGSTCSLYRTIFLFAWPGWPWKHFYSV